MAGSTKRPAGVGYDRVVALFDDPDDVIGIAKRFEAEGFQVDLHTGSLRGLEVNQCGAIIHVARSANAVRELLGDASHEVAEEEWLLLEGEDGTDDVHCSVQLMPHATQRLRVFIRTLWAQFNMT